MSDDLEKICRRPASRPSFEKRSITVDNSLLVEAHDVQYLGRRGEVHVEHFPPSQQGAGDD